MLAGIRNDTPFVEGGMLAYFAMVKGVSDPVYRNYTADFDGLMQDSP